MDGQEKGSVPGSGEKAQPWESIAEAIQSLTEPVRLSPKKQGVLASATEAARKRLAEAIRATDTEAVTSAHLAWVAYKKKEDAYIGTYRHLLPKLKEALHFIFQKILHDDTGHSPDEGVHLLGASFLMFSVLAGERSVDLELFVNRDDRTYEEGAHFSFFCRLRFTIGGHVFLDSDETPYFKIKHVPELRSWRKGIVYAIQLLESVCRKRGRSLARRQKTVSKLSTRVQSEMDAMKLPRIGRSKASKRK